RYRAEEETRMDVARHVTMEELEAGLDEIRRSPKDEGVLKMIVRRPRSDEREVLDAGDLDPGEGLVGDSWKHRVSSRSSNSPPDPDTQLNVMNSRVIALVAQDTDRW